ncbi:bifunctional enoyl-CoA hydratase/phosphate acetyltransferase [candidate division KSB1 bacterium]|nr:bifunctional enoyl-CoA hydratase/phosphate acetyltransferase [candidate division KSB1 bacterium]
MICTFDQLFAEAQAISQGPDGRIRVVIAGGHDDAALSALLEAYELGLADGLLVGDTIKIHQQLEKLSPANLNKFDIVDVKDEFEICKRAMEAIHWNEAQIVLKGKVKTASLLKAAFDPQTGLRSGRLISDIFLFEFPGRQDENKLLIITDGGFNLAPDLKEKVQIIENAVQVAHALGNDNPKVAVLSAVETINPNMQSAVDAAILSKMNDRGQITGCVVDGPLALDNALSEEAAAMKGIHSSVAGHADVLLCPTIESANMLAKGTIYFAGLRLAHATMGAKAPVLIPSRSDTKDSKLMTIALNVIIAHNMKS